MTLVEQRHLPETVDRLQKKRLCEHVTVHTFDGARAGAVPAMLDAGDGRWYRWRALYRRASTPTETVVCLRNVGRIRCHA